MPIRFPENDLTEQYISNSYQNVVQQYITTSSLEYILDGYGNVIFSIPSASFGNTILTQDQTASYALNALTTSLLIISQSSVSISSSWSSQSLSSSYSFFSTLANVSLISEQSLSASISETSSFLPTNTYQITSSVSVSASYAPIDQGYSASISTQFGAKQNNLVIGNGYSITSSWSNNSINSQNSVTSSYSLTSSYLIYPSSILTAVSNSTTNLISLSNTTYNSIFITYILNDTRNFRAGNIVVLYNTQSTVLTETSTTDIGDSSGLLFSASLNASNVNLLAINGTANNYTIKYHFDVL